MAHCGRAKLKYKEYCAPNRKLWCNLCLKKDADRRQLLEDLQEQVSGMLEDMDRGNGGVPDTRSPSGGRETDTRPAGELLTELEILMKRIHQSQEWCRRVRSSK